MTKCLVKRDYVISVLKLFKTNGPFFKIARYSFSYCFAVWIEIIFSVNAFMPIPITI